MKAKFLDRVREVPLADADLEGYVTVQQAVVATGLSQSQITNGIHHSRRVGSVVVGNSRLVCLVDVKELAAAISAKTKEKVTC